RRRVALRAVRARARSAARRGCCELFATRRWRACVRSLTQGDRRQETGDRTGSGRPKRYFILSMVKTEAFWWHFRAGPPFGVQIWRLPVPSRALRACVGG